MFSPEAFWDELVLQTRLRYLSFKRIVGMLEAVILLMLLLILLLCRVPQPYFGIALFLQACKVIGEVWNHFHLSHLFKAPDRWAWFPWF